MIIAKHKLFLLAALARIGLVLSCSLLFLFHAQLVNANFNESHGAIAFSPFFIGLQLFNTLGASQDASRPDQGRPNFQAFVNGHFLSPKICVSISVFGGTIY